MIMSLIYFSTLFTAVIHKISLRSLFSFSLCITGLTSVLRLADR